MWGNLNCPVISERDLNVVDQGIRGFAKLKKIPEIQKKIG